MSIREEILDEAKQYVSKDRNSTYDEPENNFGRIADIMSTMGYTKGGSRLQPHDVALMMLAVKLARLAHTPGHRDSWTDTAGYAACGYDAYMASQQKEQEVLDVRRAAGDPSLESADQAEIDRLTALSEEVGRSPRAAGKLPSEVKLTTISELDHEGNWVDTPGEIPFYGTVMEPDHPAVGRISGPAVNISNYLRQRSNLRPADENGSGW